MNAERLTEKPTEDTYLVWAHITPQSLDEVEQRIRAAFRDELMRGIDYDTAELTELRENNDRLKELVHHIRARDDDYVGAYAPVPVPWLQYLHALALDAQQALSPGGGEPSASESVANLPSAEEKPCNSGTS